MRLHSIYLAPHDWSSYRQAGEVDGRVLRSALFERGLSTDDFPELPTSIREVFSSLGVHVLLAYALKHFGYACSDRHHPAHEVFIYNVEREWAWSVGNAFMNEVSVNARFFVQPGAVLCFLGRVAAELPDVPLHPHEHGTQHVPWSYSFVLDLMHPSLEVAVCHHRPWTDYTTNVRSNFLAYDRRADALVARPNPPAGPTSRGGGGVGSAAREARRKRYRNLDGEPSTPLLVEANPFRAPPGFDASQFVAVGSPTPSLPPLNIPGGASLQHFRLTREEIRAVPDLVRALGSSVDRTWDVSSLLSTLSGWYMARCAEACRLGAERAAFSSQLRQLQSEMGDLRESSRRQESVLERAVAERDRYRRERDTLRSLPALSVPRPSSGSVPRPRIPDTYEGQGYVPPAAGGSVAPVDPPHPWPRHVEVAMPPRDEMAAETPRHPSYCPPSSYGAWSGDAPQSASR